MKWYKTKENVLVLTNDKQAHSFSMVVPEELEQFAKGEPLMNFEIYFKELAAE